MSQVQELQARLQELAKLEEIDLRAQNLQGLRKILYSIKITEIERDGKPVSVNSSRKVEVIETILQATAPYRLINQLAPGIDAAALANSQKIADDAYEISGTVLGDIAKSYLETIQKITQDSYVDGVWQDVDFKLQSLALKFIKGLENKSQSVNTLMNERKKFNQLITEMAEGSLKDYWHPFLNANVKRFVTHIYKNPLAESWGKTKITNQKNTLEVRNAQTSEVDLTELLNHSYKVLSNLPQEIKPGQWKEVVLALAFVTGRRAVSELMVSAEFTITGTHSVMFTGQAKSKKKDGDTWKLAERDSFEIPTLIPAKYCVDGLEWLKRSGVRTDLTMFDGDLEKIRERMHNNQSRYVSERTKVWAKTYLNSQVEELQSKMTVHKWRQLYAMAAVKQFIKPNQSEQSYMCEILGHGEQDYTTGQAYRSDFKLSADSLLMIEE